MRIISQFDDETIEKLFGADDAENERDDRFKEYFYYNKVFSNIDNDLPIRLLVGHKGIGKSALLKRAFLKDREQRRLAIRLQPGDILGLRKGEPIEDFNIMVERWKGGLLAAIALKIVREFANDQIERAKLTGLSAKIATFVPFIAKQLQQRSKKIADDVDAEIVRGFAQGGPINVYMDDIDRGWSASEADIRNISALLNAVRDISGSEQRVRFRIGLRTDVYYLVRTSDESTDKIERHVVWMSWTNHEILCVIAKRITTYFGDPFTQEQIFDMSQVEISTRILSRVIESRFQGAGHWSNRPIHNVLTSLSRRRPRDMIKLMHGAARKAFSSGHQIIKSGDLKGAFDAYSADRLQDITNEFRTELPNIERLIVGFKPSRKGRRTSESYLFTTDALVAKLRNIMQNVPLQFRSRRPATPRALIQFLYKIEFITARMDTDEGIQRRHFDQNRFLASEIAEFGYDWEIHPAYRWALQPYDVHKILDSIHADET